MEVIETSIAMQIFNKINEVRLNPKKYANKITHTMSYINKRDNTLKEPNKPVVKLTEGIKAYEEAITYFKSIKPIEELIWEDSLSKIAQDHASDIGKKGVNTSNSSDEKIKFKDRFKKLGNYSDLQESLIFGEEDITRIIMTLFVCDGDEKRTNRDIFLSSQLRQIGIGFDKHSKFNFVCVIDIARNWKLQQLSTKSSIKPANSTISKYSVLNTYSVQNLDDYLDMNKINLADHQECLEKIEKELENDYHFDNYVDKTEEKQLITEGPKIKMLQKIKFKLADGNSRTVILSKTWLIKN